MSNHTSEKYDTEISDTSDDESESYISCSMCFSTDDIEYIYCNTHMCWDCYKNQMSHSQFDKSWDELTEEEQDELVDFISEM